jgi:flagellar hook-length control protein FliK
MTLDAWQEAIETANASAEMNNAATLSALDELLDGLPRGVLEEALARTLGMAGASAGLFDQIASALDAQVLSVGGGEAGMLAYLGGSSGQTPGGGQEPGAAELFADFLKETFPDGPINTTDSLDADNLVAAFEKWLEANGKPTNTALGLSGDVNKLVQSLVSHLRGDNPATALPGTMAELFSWAVATLEGTSGDSQTAAAINAFAGLIATSDGAKTLGEALSPDADGGSEGGRDGSAALQAAQQQNQTADAARAAPAPGAASMSSMLDQIENIERLAEAMRLAAKGGVKNLTMQLTPDELGKVMLKVEARNGVVSAYLRVEKPEAAEQLANNLQQLRENLKAQGIELGRLDIQTRGQNEALGDFGGGRQHRPDDRDADGGSGGRSPRHRDDITEGVPSPGGNEPAGPGGPGELNLFA